MNTKLFSIFALVLTSSAFAQTEVKGKAKKMDHKHDHSEMTKPIEPQGQKSAEGLREFTLFVESKNGKTVWSPEKIEVLQGEKFILKMAHDMPEGFAFHGVEIADLKLRFQVNRGQPMQTEVVIPADMKPGEYEIKCHFHPAHQSSKLVVKSSTGKKPTKPF